MAKKTYFQRKEDDIKILISEAKTKNNLTDKALAKKIGMNPNTFSCMKLKPGDIDLKYIWRIEELAGSPANKCQ